MNLHDAGGRQTRRQTEIPRDYTTTLTALSRRSRSTAGQPKKPTSRTDEKKNFFSLIFEMTSGKLDSWRSVNGGRFSAAAAQLLLPAPYCATQYANCNANRYVYSADCSIFTRRLRRNVTDSKHRRNDFDEDDIDRHEEKALELPTEIRLRNRPLPKV